MSLSEKELESRKFTIGSSDVPAILGLSPFKGKAEILADKLLERKILKQIWIVLGHKLERPIAEVAVETKKLTGATLLQGWTVTKDWKSCTPDFYLTKFNLPYDKSRILRQDEASLLEVKNVGMHKMRDWAWGKEVPRYVQAQAQWQMSLLGYNLMYIVALMGGNDVKVFPIKREDVWLVDIEKQCRTFYDEHLAPGKRDEPELRIRLERLRATSYKRSA